MSRSKQKAAADAVESRDLTSEPLFRIVQGLAFLKIVLLIFVFDPNASDAFSLPKSAVTHAISYALLLALGWLIVRHGRSVFPPSPVHYAAAAVVIAFTAATPFALNLTVAVFGTWRRYLGFGQIADYGLLYLATVASFRTPTDRARLLVVGLATAVPVVGYTFLQRLGIDIVTYKDNTLPVATIGQPDTLGAYAAIVAVTALAALVFLWERLTLVARIGLVALAGGTLAVDLITGIRSGILAIAFGWLALLAIIYVRGPRAGRFRIALALGVAVAAVIVASPIRERLSPDHLRTDLAIQQRIEIWDTAWRLVASRPLLGLGPDNFANGYPAARTERSQLLVVGETENSTHSWPAYVATSAGLVGLAAMIVLIAFVIAAGIVLGRRRDPAALAVVPAIAYLGQGLVNINDLSLDWIFWLSAGVLAGGVGRVLEAPRRRGQRPLTLPLWVQIATVGAAVVVGLILAVDRIGGSRELGQAQAYVDANAGPMALPHAKIALERDPRRSELWANYGVALGASNSGAAAINAYLEATKLDPSSAAYWRDLGLEYGLIGNQTSAYFAFQRAHVADPFDPETLDLLSRIALARGDAAHSLEFGTLAVKYDPATLTAYDAPVFAALSLQRFDEAERLLQQAFARGDTPALRFREAQFYAATGRPDLALRDLDLVLAAQPSNADAKALKQQLQSR